ncbi:hypothetical protein TVAG_243550 [Trichomonas vaginalis G3]|uniref:Uncharacterized protein n=1 Tax=Trichomonas vaginalis (strain ATCC PRA-98 / G3) TaxID=412133 RepID=A2FJ88_TRIV3|nr:hypothetical protein TVAGG3_0447160 [Trichomonas vaginalis G3]EAX95002.1 hypothetical protein TVAG_243550 [Trichomonas vaginalis G3]KAI5537895.1 hypothetical protein TVAGG3_0447160 [Trichomonas vaginalis G3]|eukprot:XP_001307932.1 hypothetical protein [Trichomonas vaginalis G3]
MRDQEKILERVQQNGIKIDYVSAYINKLFRTKLAHTTLLALAKAISESTGIQLDRLAKRYKSALLCWYSENWDKLQNQIRNFNINSIANECQITFNNLESQNYSIQGPSSLPKRDHVDSMKIRSIDPTDLYSLLNH